MPSPTIDVRPTARRTAPLHLTALDAGLVLVMVVWGANFVVIKNALDVLPAFVFNAVRFSLGTVALGVIFKMNHAPLRLPRSEWPVIIVLAFLGAVYQVIFVAALENTTIANNALIIATVPVWVLILGFFRYQERFSRGAVLGVFTALGGVIMVVLGRYSGTLAVGGQTLLGDALSLLASWTWAVSILISRRPLQHNPTTASTFWILAWGAVFQALLAVPELLRMDWSLLQPNMLLAITYSGIGSIGLGSMIWNHGVKKLGTARTAIFTYLEPIVAAISAIIFLAEPFSLWLVVGAVLVFSGLVLVKKG